FPTVPDVTGLPQAEAEQVLRDAGYEPLVFNKPTANPEQVGVVLAQSPSAGEQVEPGEGVQVVIQVGVPRAPEEEPEPTETEPPPPPDDGGGGGPPRRGGGGGD